MEKIKVASKEKLMEWFKHYIKVRNYEAMIAISKELKRRNIGEPTTILASKRAPIQQKLATNDIESIIDSVVVH